VALVALLTPATPTLASGADDRRGPAGGDRLTTADRRQLQEYAVDTWRSFEAMVDEDTGLPADNIGGDLSVQSRSGYTSPTNVGAYLWSTLVARDARIIGRHEARKRLQQTLTTLAGLERHVDSGMFYNWYDPATGAKLATWPVDGNVVYPFLSSVDNGWIATALQMVARAEPKLHADADALRTSMDFGFYYNPEAENAPAGQIRGGFWDEEPAECSVPGNYSGRGADVFYTCHHYGAFNTEPRIASYLGIAAGQIPPEHYYGTWRTFPPDTNGDPCYWRWTEQRGEGEYVEHLGVQVFEGSDSYRGMQLVPTWGGSMFEALMVPLFVPEDSWGPRSWALNHPLTVQAQIEHGMAEAGYGYWGFSPSNNPDGGYREYGVDAIGMQPNGYSSDQDPRTTVDLGYEGCRDAQPLPAEYGDGVVTPHASFLALDYAPRAALDNLANLRADFDAYGEGGFYDAIDVGTGTVSRMHLSLDQGMVMAALGNELKHDSMRRYFTTPQLRSALKPLMAAEEFNVSARP